MHVAIIGSGRLASAVAAALTDKGVTSQSYSRSTGFDIFDPDARIDAADVVVEATNRFTQSADAAQEFFTRSTRTTNAVAIAAGATKHILVSIVNCDDPDLQANGYYAGKAEQERVARAEHSHLTIVRTTQWHEFALQSLNQLKFGPIGLVPTMRVQPIALEAVAQAIAQCATGERSGDFYEMAGPNITTLWRMTKALPQKPVVPVPLPVPGKAGRAFRNGSLLPGQHVERLGPTFAEWLRKDKE